MAPTIATCCYCGTRAALVLRGRDRHELACATCGAPLHALKSMPVQPRKAPTHKTAPIKAPIPPKPARRQKRRKSFGERVLSKLWDALDDVLD